MRPGICLLVLLVSLSAIGACQNREVMIPPPAERVKTQNGLSPELRSGVVADFPVGMGYSHPRLGGSVAGDLFADRFWLSGESRMLWAGKMDGGPGFSYANEGTVNLVTKKNFYIGGGMLWALTSVHDYSKSAFHPLLQAAGRFRLGNSSRLSLLVIRYTATGTDRRNHYNEIGAGIRVPMARRLSFEQYCGISHFHATDNPSDQRVGFDARVTLSYQLRGRSSE